MLKKGLGCEKPSFDSRDYQFSDLVVGVNRTKSSTFPEEYLPIITGPLYDQGDTQMCCACALSAARFVFELNDSGNIRYFSPGYIYGNRCKSSVIEGTYEGEGMYLKDAMKQLINKGICYADSLDVFGPYRFCKSKYLENNIPLDKEAYPFRISSYYAVKTEKEIMTAIMGTGAVVCSFLVTSGWFDVGKDGIIPTSGSIEGGHAVLIVGWKKINDKKYWIVQNSWGPNWGDEGFGYIEWDECKMMLEAYCLVDSIKEAEFRSKVIEEGD